MTYEGISLDVLDTFDGATLDIVALYKFETLSGYEHCHSRVTLQVEFL